MNRILGILALLVLLLFAGIWGWMGVEVFFFEPTETEPNLAFSEAVVTVAGFIASAVGAGTASVLGIEIQKVDGQNNNVGRVVNDAAKSSTLLIIGILVYAVVGLLVLVAWLKNSEAAPSVISAFSLGVLGWLAGAFAAVFRKT